MVEKKLTEQDRRDVKTYLDGLGPKLTPQMRANFETICETFALNPFLREIYGNIVQDWTGKDILSIIVGYEVYLKRAERTSLLDGWEKGCEGSVKNGDLKAWIKVYRKDWQRPFCHEVYYEEYVQITKAGKPNFIWGAKPRTMIQKVAIAQAFRMAFPEHFGGMPYTSDEMPDNMTKPEPKTEPKPEPKTETKPEQKTEPKPEIKPVDIKKVREKILSLGDETFAKFMIAKKWLKEGQTVDNLTEDQLITLENNWETMMPFLKQWTEKQAQEKKEPVKTEQREIEEEEEKLERERLENMLGEMPKENK
jgi:phage recombination protein Bet